MLPLTRTRWFPWLLAAVTIGALGVVIALAGGFAPALADRGERVEPGSPVGTRHWRVVVQEATLERPDGAGEPVIQVRVELTNTGDETLSEPRRGMLELDVDGATIDDARWYGTGGRDTGFDPLIGREAIAEFPAPGEAGPGDPVVIVVRTEEESWSYADGVPTEALGDPVAQIELELRDGQGPR